MRVDPRFPNTRRFPCPSSATCPRVRTDQPFGIAEPTGNRPVRVDGGDRGRRRSVPGARDSGGSRIDQAGDSSRITLSDRRRAPGVEGGRVGADLAGTRHVSPAVPNVSASCSSGLGLGVIRVVLDHGGLDASPSEELDVALGGVDPTQADHEDDDEQEGTEATMTSSAMA